MDEELDAGCWEQKIFKQPTSMGNNKQNSMTFIGLNVTEPN